MRQFADVQDWQKKEVWYGMVMRFWDYYGNR